jgi:hypothetical protein
MSDETSMQEDEREYEEGELTCSLQFEIDGHKVSMSSGYDYETQKGLASMGWVFGNSVGEVLLSLRPHMNWSQWQDFVHAIESKFDDYEQDRGQE